MLQAFPAISPSVPSLIPAAAVSEVLNRFTLGPRPQCSHRPLARRNRIEDDNSRQLIG